MRILVTGITGTIGGSILKALAATEHQIVAYGINAEAGQKAISQFGPNVSLLIADPALDAQTQFYRATADCQGIVHAGFNMGRPGDQQLELDIISGVLKRARETAQKQPVHFVFNSGGLVSGQTGPELTGEDQRGDEHCLQTPILLGRLAHEKAAWAGNSEKVFVATTRPSCIYGGSHVDTYFRACKKNQKIVIPNVSGKNRISYVHKEDLGEFFKRLVLHDSRGMYHVTESGGPTLDEVVEIARRVTGVQEVEKVDDVTPKLQEYGFYLFELTINSMLDAKKGREQFGFVPKHNFLRDAHRDLVL
jgi:nucleoside-diphosphate-sugar epimerase